STMTANQCAVAKAVESSGSTVLFAAALSLSEPKVNLAFDQLTGEVHASAKAALLEGVAMERDSALARMRIDASHGGAWIKTYGSWRRWGGNSNVAAMRTTASGALIGMDA